VIVAAATGRKWNPQITQIPQIKNKCETLLDGLDFLILFVRICEICVICG